MLVLLAALATAHGAARAPDRDGALAASTAAFVVAAIVASTVSTFFEIFPMEVYFWLLLTVVSGVAVRVDSADPRRRMSIRPNAAAVQA
jgi:hypothetical protein